MRITEYSSQVRGISLPEAESRVSMEGMPSRICRPRSRHSSVVEVDQDQGRKHMDRPSDKCSERRDASKSKLFLPALTSTRENTDNGAVSDTGAASSWVGRKWGIRQVLASFSNCLEGSSGSVGKMKMLPSADALLKYVPGL
ncbi:hypothetical protein SODALDRAFT_364155 [Sodiomyces alkalinus F11]|uniref:Uncharacterized protein n=1 Tax=Sodiomyces alkalinus (strain CBS 110278 / VKM F-3762 / F11) TaxID=1314773 RepID=A0A3N2PJF0_SODAK|nr:hypothetical protein SODALDRAFT_364155 [Sodiomyces alkalinus F11]ROT34653.1 hypothetical protein SODALDRAFT_364155 [Sodiomyces alkalinus F11]